jgi:hypothetical protein
MRICLLGFNISMHTRRGGTRTTGSTRITGIYWVCGVQPQHVGIVIIPKGHHQDNTRINCFLNLSQTSLVQEVGAILGLSHPIRTIIICDRLVLFAIHSVRWMLNSFPILGVELFHLSELAVISAISRDELGGDGDWLCAVNLEVHHG